MMQKNIPDRIKLILQFIVFSLGAWLPLIFIVGFICMILSINIEGPKMVLLIWGLLVVSFLIQGAILMRRWKKLRQQEIAGDLPDMKDMRNIPTKQIILFVMGFPFLIAGVVLFQLHSRFAGVLCLIPFLVFWVVDTVNTRRRFNKIKEENSIK